MAKNLIILTHGWTGSSVFSALVERAGYWTGSETVKKVDYDTHENADLVELNRRLMKHLRYDGNHEHEFSFDTVQQLAERASGIDLAPNREFVARCNEHRPWVWKDPRLTWTIRIWEKVLPMSDVAFMILTRDDTQAWISSNMRRHVQSMRFTKEYNHGITAANIRFLRERSLPYVQFEFEDLLMSPEKVLDELSSFLGLSLSMEDLKAVYRYPLGRKSRGLRDRFLATLIYLKNYSERSA
jgi:hypothetical protein